MGDRKRWTRPRTKVYDCNYNIGENYYRPTLERLDRKYGGGPLETIDAPQRPTSLGHRLESLLGEREREEPPSDLGLSGIHEQMAEDVAAANRRIVRARARDAPPSVEEGFDSAFFNRREQVKKRFSEKLLDSVGINGSSLADEESASTLRRRTMRRVAEAEDEMERPMSAKWSAMRESMGGSVDAEDVAAKARARMSRVRLADLENEMEELAERGAARERRLTGLRDLLGENQDAIRMKKTVTITEKRVV